MPEGNNPGNAGTAAPVELSLDEAVDRHSQAEQSGQEPVQPDNPLPDEPGEADPPEDLKPWDSETAADENQEPKEEDQAQDEGEDQPREQGRFVGVDGNVRLPDGNVVKVKDLIDGNLRLADYTRKTQEVASERHTLESRSAQLQDYERQVMEAVQLNQAFLQAIQPEPPQWNSDDPIGSMEAKAHYEQQLQQWNTLAQGFQQQTQQARQRYAQQQQEAYRNLLLQNQEVLVGRHPWARDPSKREAFKKEFLDGPGKEWGFTADDLNALVDHRYGEVIIWAMRGWKAAKGRPQADRKVQGKPPVQTPGRQRSNAAMGNAHIAQLEARFRQTGSIDDATELELARENLKRKRA